MGMSSYCCKGCGHELKEGELVRLNGCVGDYDGYGRAGGFDHLEGGTPIAWHNRCYVGASVEDKLDETPSKHASNQGFGFAALENVDGYDSQAKTTYQAVVYVDHYDSKAEQSTRQQYYVVPTQPATFGEAHTQHYQRQDSQNFGERGAPSEATGAAHLSVAVPFKLADKYAYEAAYEAANAEHPMWDERPDDWYATTNEAEQKAFYEQAQATIEEEIGQTSPARSACWFDDLNEAKRVLEALLPSLPNPDYGYEFAIFGKQDGAEGVVYKFNKIPGHSEVVREGEFYPHGGPKYDYPFDGTFKEEVVFIQGRNAEEGVVASY